MFCRYICPEMGLLGHMKAQFLGVFFVCFFLCITVCFEDGKWKLKEG